MSLVDGCAEESFLSVVGGNPTPQEIAALVVVLLERESDADAAAPAERRTRSAWADPAEVLGHRRHRVRARESRVFPGA